MLLKHYKKFGRSQFQFIILKTGEEFLSIDNRRKLEKELIKSNADIAYNNCKRNSWSKGRVKGKVIKYKIEGDNSSVLYFSSIAVARRILKWSHTTIRNKTNDKSDKQFSFLSKSEIT